MTFLDKDGHAVSTLSGYAIKTYQRDMDGTIVGEQYFDTEGNPARSLLGQYGELYQRNEQGYIGQITYLGADGKPTPTNAGYTILKRTYHRDGTAIRICILMRMAIQRLCLKGSTASNAVAR